jgi:hypothetical protein
MLFLSSRHASLMQSYKSSNISRTDLTFDLIRLSLCFYRERLLTWARCLWLPVDRITAIQIIGIVLGDLPKGVHNRQEHCD